MAISPATIVMSTHNPGKGPWSHHLPSIQLAGVTMFEHSPSAVRFSTGARGFRVDATHRYDKRAHDVSVRYAAGSSAIVSTYVHPFDLPRTTELFKNLFDTNMSNMVGMTTAITRIDERRTTFAHATSSLVLGRRGEVTGAFRIEHAPRDFADAFLEMFVFRTWILKIRATYRASFRNETEQFVDHWLAQSGFGSESI